jgi:hypothetical protein
MQVRLSLVIALTSAGLGGCAQASAATVDVSRDIDCSVVVFYFNRLAAQQGAEESQQRALNAVHKWYSLKVQAAAKTRGADHVLHRAGPILESVNQNPMSMRDELAACASRAVKEGLR